MRLYVPTWPGLAPGDLVRRRSRAPLPFPLNARSRGFYYRARNALYHLFRALRRDDSDWALVPDYHHSNEVSAIRAAGFGVRFYPVRRDLSVDLDALARLLQDRRACSC
jgi:selenocysteine lyase/cysteine desulfurase